MYHWRNRKQKKFFQTDPHKVIGTDLYICVVSLHHMWNGARFLSPDVECQDASRVAEWLKA